MGRSVYPKGVDRVRRDFAFAVDDDSAEVDTPCATNAVRHKSKGYVVAVAQHPAIAPDTKAAAVAGSVVY